MNYKKKKRRGCWSRSRMGDGEMRERRKEGHSEIESEKIPWKSNKDNNKEKERKNVRHWDKKGAKEIKENQKKGGMCVWVRGCVCVCECVWVCVCGWAYGLVCVWVRKRERLGAKFASSPKFWISQCPKIVLVTWRLEKLTKLKIEESCFETESFKNGRHRFVSKENRWR